MIISLKYLIIFAILIASAFVYYSFKSLNYVYDRIDKVLSEDDTVLDLGCGSCNNSKRFKSNKFVNMDVVNASKYESPIIYDGKNIPLDDKSIDVGIVSFVLHHVDDVDPVINSLKRVIKKRLIVFEDTPLNCIDTFFNKKHACSEWGKGNFLHRDEWIKKFAKHGFECSHKEYINRFEFPFAQKPWFYPVSKSFMVFENISA